VAQFVRVPVSAIEPATLGRLLEEYCSRDGTDYGLRETPLDVRTAQLRRQLECGQLHLLFDADSESWDIVDRVQAATLLGRLESNQEGYSQISPETEELASDSDE
jgi:uncharacterized protein YheU (UPF0270 family)